MTSRMNVYSASCRHFQSACIDHQKVFFKEEKDFCEEHNDSAKEPSVNISDGDPFDLPAAWADIVATCTANAGKSFTDSWSTISISNSANIPWGHGVLAPGGIIYGIPYNNTQILRIDTNKDTASLFGSFSGSADYACGTLAPDGFIYCLPGKATTILKIDPKTDSYTTIGDVSELGSVHKWGGACVASNGCIYGIPTRTSKILKFNPRTEVIDYIDTTYTTIPSQGLWFDAIPGRNGCIYGNPSADIPYLKIDPKTDTYTTFGNSPVAYAWGAFTIAPNERIYAPGYQSSSELKINTDSDSISTLSSYQGSFGSVLAPNGYIYGIPRAGYNLLKINPATDAISRINMSMSEQGQAILAPNGCIYALPLYGSGINRILKINPGADVCQNFKESTLLSPYLNKY